MTRTSSVAYPLTLYYDGSCALCSSEIRNLQLRDSAGRLAFVDCSPRDFTGGPAPREALMNAIHSVDAAGRVHVGVQTFRQAYAAVGMNWVRHLLDLPLVGRVAERAYPHLVRNRYRLPRRWIEAFFDGAARRAAQRAERNSRACRDGACELIRANHDEGAR